MVPSCIYPGGVAFTCIFMTVSRCPLWLGLVFGDDDGVLIIMLYDCLPSYSIMCLIMFY
jgi:hypothetical protein